MKVVFYGTPEFSVPTLDALVAAGHELLLVVSQPDRPAGRGNRLNVPAVAQRAVALGLPLAQPKALKSGPFPERIASLGADVAVVIAYGRILTPSLLAAPRFGCVNVHASLLPRWRGAAPIQHAVLAGDAVSGVCTQRMEEGLDTGPLYLCRETPLDPRETASTLHDRLMAMAATIAVDTLALLPGDPVPQSTDGVTWASKIEKADGQVTFALPAVDIDRRVRAYGSAFVETPDGSLRLEDVRPVEVAGTPGTLLSVNPAVVACGTGGLELVTVRAAGRKPVSGRDFVNGLRAQVGEPLIRTA
jgi:methionyl-tRNA formyltransferase